MISIGCIWIFAHHALSVVCAAIELSFECMFIPSFRETTDNRHLLKRSPPDMEVAMHIINEKYHTLCI